MSSVPNPQRHSHEGPAPYAAVSSNARTIDYRKTARRSVLWGLLAGLGMGLVYLIIVSAVNSFESAVTTFLSLWYWLVPIVVGFGLQVALFTYGRGLAKTGAAPHASGVMASGGTSAVSMIACCSHYLSNVLPLLGLTGLSLILSNYQTLFLLAGLLSNLLGIAYLLGVMGQHRLYDTEGKGLALLLKWPIHRFVPYVAAVAAAILLIAIYLEVFK